MTTRWVGIGGKMGSGKDTLASMMTFIACVKYGHYFERVGFADQLKATATQWMQRAAHSHKDKNSTIPWLNMTMGQFLQKLGDAGRTIHPDLWIQLLFRHVPDTYRVYCRLVADVRYPNECDAIRERGGFVVYMMGDPMGVNKDDSRDHQHSSEQALAPQHADHVYLNIGTLEDMMVYAETLVDAIVEPKMSNATVKVYLGSPEERVTEWKRRTGFHV